MLAYNYNLIAVDLSNFNSSKVTNLQGIFFQNNNLKFLNLTNFKANSATNVLLLFHNLTSLVYLNLKTFVINDNIEHQSYKGLQQNLKYYLDDSNTLNILFGNNAYSDCNDICFSENIKFDITNNQCVYDCTEGKFEYKNICSDSCIQGYPLINDGKYICLDDIPENYFYDSDNDIYKECY